MAKDIYLYNMDGQAELHRGVDEIETDTPTPGVHAVFTEGVIEQKNVTLDFSNGSQTEQAASGKLWRQITIPKPSSLAPMNIRRGISVAGISGEYAGGAGWNPTGADYSWTYAFFNKYYPAVWDRILPMLTYTNDECVIAKFFTAAGVEGAELEKLIAVDFSSEGLTGVYGVFYVRTVDPGTEEEWMNWEPVYATDAIPATGGGGLFAAAGFNTDVIELSYCDETGSLVPVIDEPDSGSPAGWNALWAGWEIAFGNFDDEASMERTQAIINNEVTYLTAKDFQKWFHGVNSSSLVIRGSFFKNNSALETVEFAPLLYDIGESAFEGCTALTQVGFPIIRNMFYLLTYVRARAFYGCTALETVDLGGMMYLSVIEDYAFANCPNLKSVTIRQSYPVPQNIGTGVFDTTSLEHIYVPASAVNSYKAAAGWSAYASYITAIPS